MTRPIDPQQVMANNVLLDLVAARTNARSDRDLTIALQCTAPTISKIRNGHMPLGAAIQLAMLEHCGIELSLIRRYVPSRPRGAGQEAA